MMKDSPPSEGGTVANGLFPKILVPIDFSACSEEAFRVALALARVFQSDVLLLHVVDTKSLATLNGWALLDLPRRRHKGSA
jgi:nucleotide-binding universal stress UspA family protein